MDLSGFEFALPAPEPEPTSDQRMALALLTEAIHADRPPALDPHRTEVVFDDDDLGVLIAHKSRDDFAVAFTVASERVTRVATVQYAGAMFSFFADDPAAGRLWPLAADNHVEAAVALVRELLLGRVEVEMRRGLLFRRLRSYLVDDSGERELIHREVWVAPRPWVPTSDIVRVDFGATAGRGPRREW